MERLSSKDQITELNKTKPGKLTTVWGSMFSGKTGEVIEIIDQESFADRIALMIKPSSDQRYAEDKVVTHRGVDIDAENVDPDNPEQVFDVLERFEKEKGKRVDIVAWDEAQFFSHEIVEAVEELIEGGRDVIVAGLAVDANDQAFGAMPLLIAKADKPIHLTAVCTYRDDGGTVCGNDATKTQRLVEEGGQVLIGGVGMYAAHCRRHHKKQDWDE